jgi:hypothetical protein
MSRGSSVSIVSDYRLDDWATAVRSPAEAKAFCSSLCVHTGSEAHPASYPTRTDGPFLQSNARPVREADNSSHLVPRSRRSRRNTFSPPFRLHDGSRTDLHLQLVLILAPKYKQHILSPSKLECYSLAEFYVKSVWVYSGEGGMQVLKHFTGGGGGGVKNCVDIWPWI